MLNFHFIVLLLQFFHVTSCFVNTTVLPWFGMLEMFEIWATTHTKTSEKRKEIAATHLFLHWMKNEIKQERK